MSCERENEHVRCSNQGQQNRNSFDYVIIVVLYILLAIILATCLR